MSRKILSKEQISKLSIDELLKYKKELNQKFRDLKAEINFFVEDFNFTKKCLSNKLLEMQKYRDKLLHDVIFPEEKSTTIH